MTTKADTAIVCSACLTESCFAGVLMCEEARSASTTLIRRAREAGKAETATDLPRSRIAAASTYDDWRQVGRDGMALIAAVEAALSHHQRIDRGGPDLRPVCSCSRVLWPCPEIADVLAALAEGGRGDG